MGDETRPKKEYNGSNVTGGDNVYQVRKGDSTLVFKKKGESHEGSYSSN